MAASGWNKLPPEVADMVIINACLAGRSPYPTYKSFTIHSRLHAMWSRISEFHFDDELPRRVEVVGRADRDAFVLVSRRWARTVRAYRFQFQEIATRGKAMDVIRHLENEASGTLVLPFGALVRRLTMSWQWELERYKMRLEAEIANIENLDEDDYFEVGDYWSKFGGDREATRDELIEEVEEYIFHVIRILQQLPKLVCFRTVDRFTCASFQDQSFVTELVQHGTNLAELELHFQTAWRLTALLSGMSKIPSLKKLSLSVRFLIPEQYTSDVHASSHITDLTLCEVPLDKLDLERIVHLLPSLQSLGLRGVFKQRETTFFLPFLHAHSSKLVDLSVRFDAPCGKDFAGHIFTEILKVPFPRLRALLFEHGPLPDKFIATFRSRADFPSLRFFSLRTPTNELGNFRDQAERLLTDSACKSLELLEVRKPVTNGDNWTGPCRIAEGKYLIYRGYDDVDMWAV